MEDLVDEALLQHDVGHPTDEPAERPTEDHGDRDEAIRCRVDESEPDPSLHDPTTRSMDRLVVPWWAESGLLGGEHHRGLPRDIDVLATAGDRPSEVSDHGCDRAFQTGVEHRLGEHRRLTRSAVRVPTQAHRARRGFDRQAVRGPGRLRAREPERGHRDDDEGRVQRHEIPGAEAQILEPAWTVGVKQHVCARSKSAQVLATPVAVDLEVEHATPLTPVERPERKGAVRVIYVVGERPVASNRRTVRRLDEHHIGAEIGEQLPGKHRSAIGQIQDANVFEHHAPSGTLHWIVNLISLRCLIQSEPSRDGPVSGTAGGAASSAPATEAPRRIDRTANARS